MPKNNKQKRKFFKEIWSYIENAKYIVNIKQKTKVNINLKDKFDLKNKKW